VSLKPPATDDPGTPTPSWVRRLLIPSPLEDHPLAPVAVALQVLVVVASLIPVFLALTMPRSYLPRARALEILALAVAIPLIITTRRGKVLTAGTAAIVLMWVILTGACLTASGVRNPAFSGYIVLIAGAGLLLGRKPAFALASASVFSGAVLLALDARGLVPHSDYTPAAIWVFNTLYFVMAASVIGLASRQVIQMSDRARRENIDRLQAEAALRESDERFRRIADASHEGIVFTERGVVVDANPQIGRLYGYEMSEMIGRPVQDFLAPASIELVEAHIGSGAEDAYEIQLLHKNGTEMYAEARIRSIPFEGRQIRVTALRDITERKRAEDERLRLVSAIEQAAELIVITDLEGRIHYVNRSVETIAGHRREDLVGQPVRRLLGLDERDADFRELLHSARAQVPWLGRLRCRRIDGTPYVADISLAPVRSVTGEAVALVGVGRDITRDLLMEDQLRQSQKMESIGQLAGGIAHDFNNLMQPILGYADLMLDELPVEHPHHEQLEIIRDAAARATRLTQQLLTFGRKQVVELRSIDVGRVAQEFQPILRRTIREDIDIEVHASAGPVVIKGDTQQIEQVLMNLAVNAQDAMEHGGRLSIDVSRIDVSEEQSRARPDIPAGSYVRMSVADTGSGIDPEAIPHIFEPFFTTKEKGKGTGLGLATVYGIVTQHQGHVRVESAPGKGTSIDVYLPRRDDASLQVPTPTPSLSTRTGTELVVVAEDSDMVRGIVCGALRQDGYRVIEVAQPEQCLAILEAQPERPDLLLTDVVMPRMNGRQLHEQLAARYPGLRVLYMSGYLDDVIGRHGVLEDGVNYIQKPFSVKALSTKVREVLGQ
jgi:two-component system cell cycle sensor histidine kinase/response regulator CckA